MKYRLHSALALLLALTLLLSACVSGNPNPTDTTTEPTETTAAASPTTDSTVPPTTDPLATEPSTVPTEPAEPLEPDAWQPACKPMSYEDFFKEDRLLLKNDSGWYTARDGGYALATVKLERTGLIISISDTESTCTVPQTQSLSEHTMLCADGYYAYLQGDNRLLRVELATGAKEIILSADRIWSLRRFGNHVIFYIATIGETTSVCRMYLPTLTVDILYDKVSADVPEGWLLLDTCYSVVYQTDVTSTHSDISWETIHPDMLARLREVLADQNSPYKQLSPENLWNYDDPMEAMEHGDIRHLCQAIQEKEGIYPYLKGTYHVSDGTYSETPGILDDCWCGSGHPVDHFDLNTYDVTPTWNLSQPVTLENILLPDDPSALYEPDRYRIGYPALTDLGDGIVRPVSGANGIRRPWVNDSVRSYIQLHDYAFLLTGSNTVIQYDFATGQSAVIYTAQYGKLSFPVANYGRLYFLDGETLMEIDLPAKTCRSLMTVPNLHFMSLDDARQMYIETARGQSFGGFTCNFDNQTIQPGYRL